MTSSVPRTHYANVPQAQRGPQTGFSFTDSRIALGRDIMCLFNIYIYIYIFLFLMIVRGRSKKTFPSHVCFSSDRLSVHSLYGHELQMQLETSGKSIKEIVFVKDRYYFEFLNVSS